MHKRSASNFSIIPISKNIPAM